MSATEYPIGLTFKRHYSKNPRLETVVDRHTTIDSMGHIIRVTYVTTQVVAGQLVYDYTVPASTIARSLPTLHHTLNDNTE